MKTYQINIRPTAELDIRNRYEQIYSESPKNAKHWYTDLINAIRTLEHLALRCPIAEEDSEFKLGTRFLEKPRGDGSWINGGFFVCDPNVFDYITEGDVTEHQTLVTGALVFRLRTIDALSDIDRLFSFSIQ